MTKLLLLSSIVSLAACTTGSADSDPAKPVASYVSRTGTTIELYAEDSVSFSVAELGDSSQTQLAIPSADAKTLSPSQLYLESATDHDVPPAIADLTASLVAAGRVFPATAPVGLIAPTVFDGCSASSFSATWCHLGDGDPITWCLTSQNANAQKHMSSLSSTEAGVCVKSGGLDYHITNEAGGDHEWSMGTGGFIRYSFSSGFLSYDWVHYDISGVSGVYQFAGEADN